MTARVDMSDKILEIIKKLKIHDKTEGHIHELSELIEELEQELSKYNPLKMKVKYWKSRACELEKELRTQKKEIEELSKDTETCNCPQEKICDWVFY